MKKLLVVSFISTVALGTVASAAEGRIPLLSLPGPPYLITAPGYYILTRNIGFTSGHVVQIQSDDVTLDLGGHTITGPTSLVGAAIDVPTSPGTKLITIKNGRIFSGSQGVSVSGSGRIRLEGLDISGSLGGIDIAGPGPGGYYAEIVDCRIHDLLSVSGSAEPAIIVNADGGRVTGNLVQNVPGDGLYLLGFRGGEIRRNLVRNFGSVLADASGIYLEDNGSPGVAGGAIVADNTVNGLPGAVDDEGMQIRTPGTLVTGNVVNNNGSYGIHIVGNENRIEKNMTNLNGSDGIHMNILLQRNRFEGNQSQGNGGCGFNITGTVASIYSNNTFANNTGGNICGTGINAGGNYCDTALCP
jgi:hypothetical protein